ncbi:hypothetical protein PVK62_17350, partial [Aliivibrio sp. S3MY1]|uniref:hypothetical protein n=1 Tax=unclassified Aliivibrio TaxID=2645654 RepID=UPI002379B00C
KICCKLSLIRLAQLSEQNIHSTAIIVKRNNPFFLRHLYDLVSASFELINQISLPQLGLKMLRGKH